MFEYDSRLALDIQEQARQERQGLVLRDITYASPCGGSVSAWLIAPRRAFSSAGLVFMHPSGTGRHAFLEEACLFCHSGAVALLIDAPHARSPQRSLFRFDDSDREDFVQCVVDLRRGVDLLTAQTAVDPRRIGFVGFSYGATVGAMLAGVDKRIRAYILWGGSAYLSKFLSAQGKRMPRKKLTEYVERMSVLDSIHHVSHAAPSALLFQNGRVDKNVPPPDARALHQAASEPKRVAWYDAGHALNGQARLDRYAWLREQLALAPLSPALEQQLSKFSLKQMARPRRTGL